MTITNLSWENCVSFLHTVFITFVIFAPFAPWELIVTYHFIIIPFLWMHWYTNNDVCALTLLESKLRGVESSSTYIGSIINPIYQIKNRDFYIITAVLFLITTYRLKSEFDFGLLKLSYYQIKYIIKQFF